MSGGPFNILGIGGGSAQPAQPRGILDTVGQAFADNAGLLMGYGSGGFDGAMQGMAQDERTRLIKQKQAQEEQKKVAAQQWAQKNGFDPAMAAADPDGVLNLAQNLEIKKRTPRDPQLIGSAETGYTWATPGQALPESFTKGTGPKVNWEIKTIKNSDGSETPVYFNPRTMETKPLPGYGSGSPKAAKAEAQAKQAAGIVIEDIDRALEKTNNGDVTVFGYNTGINKVTGGVGQALSNVGGTEANNVSGLVDTIQANATFDKLQQMRAASPTGAALGAVSDTENKLLGAAIGSLKQSQDKEQFVYNLKRVKKVYNEIIHGPGTTDKEGNVRGAKQAVQGGADRSALEAEARRRGLIR